MNEDTFAIEEYIERPYCFTSRDVLSWHAGEQLRYSDIFSKLNDQHSFVKVNDGPSDIYISKKSLCRWLTRLNSRLARSKVAKLKTHQLISVLNELHLGNRRWRMVPNEYIEFGGESGLICCLQEQEEFVFPVAYLISFLSPSNINAFEHYGIDLAEENPTMESDQAVIQAIQNVLESLTSREEYVITRRQGLFGNSRMTLEEIGNALNLTRERVRQIEQKCWRKLRHPSRGNRLVLPLVHYLSQSRGNLVVNSDSLENEILFITRILNIPASKFPYTDKFVLGLESDHLTIGEKSIDQDIGVNAVADIIRSQSDIPFTQQDLEVITAILREKPLRHVTKSERVYQVLKQIGRPSHYSHITEVYNDLFPDDFSSERSIHAVLGREEHGIVWTGIKGTYALKEWGFEHPSLTLFATVQKIVEKKYEETKKPVSFLIVQAEIGKYRKLVNRNSLIIASYLNPEINIVNKDQLIPSYAAPGEGQAKDISADELNRVLEDFELKTKGGVMKMNNEMTYEKALGIAKEALEAYKKAKTRADVEEVFIKYGRGGIGYRPLCRMFFSHRPPESVVQVYKKE
ncbi:MAG: sigma factor-like helix-turn-helix DNA-binding protein [Candidatus Thorarchaeota archaeon]